MSDVRRAVIFWVPAVAGVVLGAAALAAPVHEALMHAGWLERQSTPYEHDRAFLKVFRRLLLVPLLVLFVAWVRPWRDGSFRAYGLWGRDARIKTAWIACAVTLVALLAVLAWQHVMGWLHLEDPPRWGEFGERLLRMVPGGLALALIEEFFFRGYLLADMRKRIGLRFAIFLSALVYGLAHAFRPGNLTVGVPHDFGGALSALGQWLSYMFDIESFGPSFLGLFCFGVLLAVLFVRTRSLWPSIAVHAAAVWVLFSYGALTDRTPVSNWAGTKRLYDGPVVWVILLIAALLLRPRKSSALPPDGAGTSSG